MRVIERGNVTEEVASLVPLEEPKSKHLYEPQKVISKYLSEYLEQFPVVPWEWQVRGEYTVNR